MSKQMKQALDALFRENDIPMSDRNGQLYDELSAALAAKREAPVGDEASMLRDLLAVIHRDGGHYFAEHGLEKALADAHTIVLSERNLQPEAPVGEAVVWQYRWVHFDGLVGDWANCPREAAERFNSTHKTDSGHYETRPLFASPQPPQAGWHFAARELMAHISDVLGDRAFSTIDTAKWNALGTCVALADFAAPTNPPHEGETA